MSTNISVSNKEQENCYQIITKFLNLGIDCRIIETRSIVNKNIENGCLITLGPPYNDKKNITKIWNHLKGNYECAHLSIDGVYNGCIYNYIDANLCPGNNNLENVK